MMSSVTFMSRPAALHFMKIARAASLVEAGAAVVAGAGIVASFVAAIAATPAGTLVNLPIWSAHAVIAAADTISALVAVAKPRATCSSAFIQVSSAIIADTRASGWPVAFAMIRAASWSRLRSVSASRARSSALPLEADDAWWIMSWLPVSAMRLGAARKTRTAAEATRPSLNAVTRPWARTRFAISVPAK